CMVGVVRAQDPGTSDGLKILRDDPFDIVVVRQGDREVELRTFPLLELNSTLPDSPDPNAYLKLKLLEYPQYEFQVRWHHVARIERFPEILLRHAKGLTAS